MEVYDFEDDSSEEAPDTNDKIAEKLISRHKKLGLRKKYTVSIIQSAELDNLCDDFIVAKPRYKMTSELIKAYHHIYQHSDKENNGQQHSNQSKIVNFIAKTEPATLYELKKFHTNTYIETLKNNPEQILNETSFASTENSSLINYCQQVVGASIAAADELINTDCRISICWYGGWHHAKSDGYSGFCFVNDCVFAINRLLPSFHKVLYIDLDIHHGDGVEQAFLGHGNVLTFSAHKRCPGFFPGSGEDTSILLDSDFHNKSVNLEFSTNCDPMIWQTSIIQKFDSILSSFQFDAILLLCGADTLKHDPLGDGFKVELKHYIAVVTYILAAKLPTLLLGGGGYNPASAARLWTCLTLLSIESDNDSGKILNKLPNTIPNEYVTEYFLKYAPSYSLTELDKCE